METVKTASGRSSGGPSRAPWALWGVALLCPASKLLVLAGLGGLLGFPLGNALLAALVMAALSVPVLLLTRHRCASRSRTAPSSTDPEPHDGDPSR